MWIARFLAACVCLGAVQGHAFEIKGISVNEKSDCEKIRALEVRPGTFARSCENRVAMFMHRVAFLSGTATLAVQQQTDYMVTAVIVSDFDFEDALKAFSAKYGVPKTSASTIQNRMGATFDQVLAVWEDDAAYLMLKRHGSKIGEPVLSLMSKQAIERKSQERAKGAENI